MTREEYTNEAFKMLNAKIDEIIGTINKFIDSLERYQKYEIVHPRKKPRGSIRRAKKNERI